MKLQDFTDVSDRFNMFEDVKIYIKGESGTKHLVKQYTVNVTDADTEEPSVHFILSY